MKQKKSLLIHCSIFNALLQTKDKMEYQKINNEFINELRLYYGTWVFTDKKDNIITIPEDENHDYLLRNFEIDDVILTLYYAHSKRFFSEDDYNEMTLTPFPFEIFGAYLNRFDLVTKLTSLIARNRLNRPPLIDNKEIEYFEDLYPYFKEYADGFKQGYETFEDKWIIKYLNPFSDKHDFFNKVFEYLTKAMPFENNWLRNHLGFTIASIENGIKLEKGGQIKNAFNDGLKQGCFYKAWTIVLSNSNTFKPLFEKLKPKQDSHFSVLEWATIFYYANETKLLPENKFLKNRMEQFMDFHKIPTTFESFKSKYHTAKNRINKNNNYPIDKLELITPFLEKNYKQAVTLIDRDIDFLLSEKSEYQ